MATRSGDLDPSAVAWLALQAGVPTAEVDHALDHASGLLALAGDADMRYVPAARTVVVHAREDLVIARQTRRALADR
jgi:acetate kinase